MRSRTLLSWTCAFVAVLGIVSGGALAASNEKPTSTKGKLEKVAVPTGRPSATAIEGPPEATLAPSGPVGPVVAPKATPDGPAGLQKATPTLNKGSVQHGLRPMGNGQPGSTPNQGEGSRANLPEAKLPDPPPQLNGTGFTPDPSIGHIGGKIFAPGGTVHLLGFRFGSEEGSVYLQVTGSKFPEHGNQIPLVVTKWTDNLVSARIPKPMTGPIFRAGASPHLVRADGQKAHIGGHFEVPVETQVLSWKDTDRVKVLRCGDRVDANRCVPPHDGNLPTLYGHHESFGSGNSDDDTFQISLDGGWVFSRVKRFGKHVSDAGDTYESSISDLIPAIPAGGTQWTGRVKWGCRGDEEVRYEVEIEVKRAKGAY